MKRALALLSLCVTTASAGADPCPLPRGASPALAEVPTEARLAAVADGLDAAAGPASAWNWGWGLGFAVVGAAQLGTAPLFNERGRRIDFYVGGIKSIIAALSVVVLPLKAPSLNRELRGLRAGRPADCALLAEAEGLLSRSAAGERRGKGWLKHAMGIGYNVAFALVLGLGYDRWPSAGLSFATGVLVSELQIFTQPTRSVRAWRKYLETGATPPAPTVSWAILPTLDGPGVSAFVAVQF